MSQDGDIARVAAALRMPGLKYRNFGNAPVRPEILTAAKDAIINCALNAAIGREVAVPTNVEDPRSTMAQLIETAPPAAPPPASPAPTAAAAPAWPLLDALAPQPAVAEAPQGTLAQLFGGASAVPPAAAPPAGPLPMPAPLFRMAPPAAAFPPASLAPAAAIPAAGPFPAVWGAPAESAGLVPADRVTTPLGTLLQDLGRDGATPNPAFAGLRLPGGRLR